MKTYKTLLILLLATLAPIICISQITDISLISLEMCQIQARESYPIIKQLGLLDKISKERSISLSKSYLPQFSINSKATLQSDITTMYINGQPMLLLDKDQYSVGAQINQIVWDGGVVSAQKGLVELNNSLDKSKVEVELYQLREKINQIYFGILLADKYLSISKSNRALLNASLDKTEAMKKSGVATEGDVNLILIELSKNNEKYIELSSSKQSLLSVLSLLTNIKFADSVTLEIPKLNQKELKTAPQSRPEFLSLDNQKRLIDGQLKLLNTQILPKIGFFIQGGYAKPGLNILQNGWNTFLIGGVNLSWNFGALYTRKSDKIQILLNKSLVDTQKENFQLNQNIKNIQILANISKLEKLKLESKTVLDLNEKQIIIYKNSLENGTISTLDYLKALTMLESAKEAFALREIEYLSTLIEYRHNNNIH